MATKGVLIEELFAELEQITKDNIGYVSKKCIHLGENQLNWRSTSISWSVREVLSHLLSFSGYYHLQFITKINKAGDKKRRTKEYFTSSPLGRGAWKSVKLGRINNVKRKYRAFKEMDPMRTPEILDENAVSHFLENQEELLSIFESAKEVSLKRVKIPILKNKFSRLRLGDALLFVVYHNERHIQQIKNILTHKNFPKKQ